MVGTVVRFSAFVFLLAGVSCGPRTPAVQNGQQPQPANVNASAMRSDCVNLNTATEEELDRRLKGIGEVTARKIVEYRERMGPFRKPEEVIVVDGMSERKYRQIAGQLCVD